ITDQATSSGEELSGPPSACVSHVGAASASTRRCPSVAPLPSSWNVYATSPPMTTRPSGVSTRTLWCPRVAGRRQQPDAGERLRLAVVLDVGRTREVDPFVRVMR